MKKMTKWLAVCAVCVMGSVPAHGSRSTGCYCNTDPD